MGNVKVPYRGRFVVLKKLIAIETSICHAKVFVQCDRGPNPARAVYIPSAALIGSRFGPQWHRNLPQVIEFLPDDFQIHREKEN